MEFCRLRIYVDIILCPNSMIDVVIYKAWSCIESYIDSLINVHFHFILIIHDSHIRTLLAKIAADGKSLCQKSNCWIETMQLNF